MAEEDQPFEPVEAPAAPEPPRVEPLSAAVDDGKVVISAKLVALFSLVFGIACLGALALVATVHGSNALATLALALAIVSFGAQLLASSSQSHQSSQQALRSEQLNAQTSSLLAEMQTTARSTERMVRDQFGQVLHAFLDAAKTAEKGKDFDPVAFEERMLQNVRQQALSSRPDALTALSARDREAAQRAVERKKMERDEYKQARDNATKPFPEEADVADVVPTLRELREQARTRLRAYAFDKAQAQITKSSTRWEGVPLADATPEDVELASKELLHLVQLGPPADSVVYQLSEKGDRAAQLLNAVGAVPAWAEGLSAPPPDAPL